MTEMLDAWTSTRSSNCVRPRKRHLIDPCRPKFRTNDRPVVLTVLTFGYGSNMCLGRMKQRVASLRFVATASLGSYRFAINKLSKDGSAKGNVVIDPTTQVFGVVYSLDADDLETLDKSEGVGDGYVAREDLDVRDLSGSQLDDRIRVYVADPQYVVEDLLPYTWYTRHIVEGARHHGLPEAYIAWLETHPAVEDPDRIRDRQERMYPCNRALTADEVRTIAASSRRNPKRLTDYALHFRKSAPR